MTFQYLTKDNRLGMFIPVPMRLLTSELSSTAILIYGCILSRAMFSQKNGWIDKRGYVYVRYTAPQLAVDMGKGKSTVKSALKELEAAGLIERKRIGITSTNIFIKVPEESIAYESGRNSDCRGQLFSLNKPENNTRTGQKTGLSEVRKPDSSKYIKYKKEINKEYIPTEGESF